MPWLIDIHDALVDRLSNPIPMLLSLGSCKPHFHYPPLVAIVAFDRRPPPTTIDEATSYRLQLSTMNLEVVSLSSIHSI